MNDNIVLNKSKSNISDLLLILYIVLLVFGVIGDALQPIRIVSIAFVPFVLHYLFKNSDIRKSNHYILFLFIFWLAYGFFTLLWSVDTTAGLKELTYLLVNFTSFLVIVILANKSVNPKESIMKGWIILFIITIPIALYELSTDIHLPMSIVESDYILRLDSGLFERNFASVTFGNLNGYNTILMYVFPMILGSILNSNSKRLSFFLWISLFINLYILISNGSRGAILSAVIGFSIFIFFFLRNKKSKSILFLIILIAVFVFANYFNEIFELIVGRFATQGLADDNRYDIIVSLLDALFKSFLFGIGAGSLMAVLQNVYNLVDLPAHNLFLEVGVQYGIITFILFMYLFVKLYKRQKLSTKMYVKNIIIGSLCMAPLTLTIDSAYLLNSSVWLFFSSLYVISNPDLDINQNSL